MPSDYGYIQTEKELAELERRIAAVYKEASDELKKKIEEYFAQFEKRDAHQRALLDAGKITKDQYTQWRLNQIGRGKRFEDLRDKVAERYTNANEVAVAYVNDTTPGIYSLNRNYAAYTIEQAVGDVGFTLWDEQTVKRLIVEEPGLMPYYPPEKAVKRGIDLDYGKKVITKQVTSGILLGESIGKIANRLQNDIPGMERASAVRTARTSVTGAQNAGRMDSYKQAVKMGIQVQKKWVATKDNRTRHSHAMLDGEIREIDEKFSNGCIFPGEGGPPREIYNCRCRIVSGSDLDLEAEPRMMRVRDPETGRNVLIKDMTYQEWAGWKAAENKQEWDIYVKKGQNLSSDKKQWEEYKGILGNAVPNRFEDFQNLKYNEPEKWDYTKRLAQYIRKYPTSSKKYFDVQENLKKSSIKKGVALPPVQKQAYILPSGKRDAYHIMHRMIERHITDDELRGYIKNAKVMFLQWGGKRQCFVSNDGMCVVAKDGEDWVFKTAWKKSDYDEEADKIMEVIRNVGL